MKIKQVDFDSGTEKKYRILYSNNSQWLSNEDGRAETFLLKSGVQVFVYKGKKYSTRQRGETEAVDFATNLQFTSFVNSENLQTGNPVRVSPGVRVKTICADEIKRTSFFRFSLASLRAPGNRKSYNRGYTAAIYIYIYMRSHSRYIEQPKTKFGHNRYDLC